MNIVVLFFYISLAILVYSFSAPFPILDTIWPFGFIDVVALVYVMIFALHMLVKYTDKIKNLSPYLINKIVIKDNNPKKDIVKFLIVSILVVFSIDVIMVKLSDKPIENLANNAPIIAPMNNLINFSKIASQIHQFLSPIPRVDNSTTHLGLRSSSANAEASKTTTGQIRPLIDAAIGGFIIFFLRQFIYRNRYIVQSRKPKYPGSRILILFIIVSMTIFALDFITDISSGFVSMKEAESIVHKANESLSDVPYSIQTLSSNAIPGTSYGVADVIVFLFKFTNPFVYIAIISIWAFDWYLFSNVWTRYKNSLPAPNNLK